MNGKVVLRATIDGVRMIRPLELSFNNMPQIGHRLDIGDIYGPCATVLMVTHSISGFYYPGNLMRRKGINSCLGTATYFSTIIDVELDNIYTPHTAETWRNEMGWDLSPEVGKYIQWA